MKSDIEIAHSITLKPIQEIAAKLGLKPEDLMPFGYDKAKLNESLAQRPAKGKLILVTAITPNKAGVGKTTTSVALSLGLQQLGKNAIVALREPSLGPCFGMKGGAAGGGYSQVLPMEDINLHFTGDFHAITSANNTLAALIDNYQYLNQGKPTALKQILWRRVLDVNDRSLRNVLTGLHGSNNGIPTETGFDITPASEIMAILCLSTSLADLKLRLGNILVGYSYEQKPVYVRDLGFQGALTALLLQAIKPNLVQTTEHTPALVHGGPFANIAHGCNSVMATKTALALGDYVVTEAGFGADLGAEKFFDIKCRQAGLQPAVSVLVATTQALKLHGGCDEKLIQQPNSAALTNGLLNLERHLQILRGFGQKVVVAFNRFYFDTEEEIELVRNWCSVRNAPFALCEGFTQGGKGATALAEVVLKTIEDGEARPINFTYELDDDIATKLLKVVQKVYGGKAIEFTSKAQQQLKKLEKEGFGNLPICIAKTQYSFSDDATQVGVASNFTITFSQLMVNAGAGFIVAVAGDIMRMPGLPKQPAALGIDVVDGKIVGLS